MPKSWLYLEGGMGTMLSPLPYLDLAEFLSVDKQSRRLILYSIGNARGYRVQDGAFSKELQPGFPRSVWRSLGDLGTALTH